MKPIRWPVAAISLGFFLLLILPLLLGPDNSYVLYIASLIGIYALLCLGLNITIGYIGLLDLGFMAFYAIGAYLAALLSIRGVSFWLILPICALAGGLLRYLLGRPILKLRGDYLAIVTLAFGEITRLVANNAVAITNGPKGLPRVGEKMSEVSLLGVVFNDTIHYYYLILAMVAFTAVISYRLEHSRMGRAFVAIREDELAAELSGINVARVKSVAFVISGMFGALAGAIYVHWIGFVSPEMFTFWESVFLVAMIVVGGMGNLTGVGLGVVLLVGMPEVLRSTLGTQFVDFRMLVFGLVMVVVIIFRPQGLIPSRRRLLELHTPKN
ncbi:MAG: branched-chain amino acid ABC transporter permease [Deltaproteobacteria bacterium]|nr:branched-chain amino acid ABC transporter permease [Deltaproteobacteria bacterium]